MFYCRKGACGAAKMFDKFTIFSLINWTKFDGEMFRRFGKKEITNDEYEDYLNSRRLVIRLMNEGDCGMNKEELNKLDDFLFKSYTWALN